MAKKLSKEWLDKLTVRYADAHKTLMQLQPYVGDEKLMLAHDLLLIARDYREHITALESELATIKAATGAGKEVFSRSVPNLNCKPTQFDTRGPAIEGHTIAVIHSIREEEQ